MMKIVGNLPEETSSFIGRRIELLRLESALTPYYLVGRRLTPHRMTTLVGPGGVGKSRLAARAAHLVGHRYQDGVRWADLSPLYDDDLLLPTVSDAVGLADHALRMPVDALCEWLADKNMLLVLDSCEHLRAPTAHLLGELLTIAPGLTVVATSRQPLGVRGENLVDVRPLPHDGHSDALTLLRDRVRASAPGITFRRPADTEAAEEICRRLEGLPLALELAAASAGRHTLRAIADRLGSRLDVLADDSPRPLRHRALITTIGWSHELCTPLERLLWARLTPLRGDFDEEAAREVCAGGPLTPDGVTRALRGLVTKSVVKRDGERHHMLDTLREYGRMWLTELGEEEVTGATRRHAARFLRLARRAHTGWAGRDQVAWYHKVSDSHLDLCAALDHLLVHDIRAAQEMAGRIGFFWSCCGHLTAARSYAQRALGGGPLDGPDRTRLLWVLGVAALLQGDFGVATRIGAECTAYAEEDGDDEGILNSTYLAGLTHLMKSEPQTALEAAGRALRLTDARPVESAYRLRCHLITVFSLSGLGRLNEAAEAAAVLRAACEEHDEHWTRSYADYQLALIALLQGRPEVSAAHARTMLQGKHRLRDSFGIALGLDILASAIAAQGQGARAARVYGTGQVYWRMVGHPQRGTPDVTPVRETCERQARAAVGDLAYQRAFESGRTDGAEAGLAAALWDESRI